MPLLIVASTNPVKINGAKLACEAMFPEMVWEARGVSAASGVSDQPMTSNETRLGAENRLASIRAQEPEADMWMAIEGGVEDVNGQMSCFAWILAAQKESSVIGQGKTGMFFLPSKARTLILEGMELGSVDDVLFKETNTKQKNGAVGLFTGNVIDRTSYYVHAGILALIPFKNPSLYP